jgi:predicted transcriptional regulator
MPKPAPPTDVLTIRVPRDIARRLAREARRQRRTRSEVARDISSAGLGEVIDDPLAEARRQSLLVRERESEGEAIRFITDTADLRGWT